MGQEVKLPDLGEGIAEGEVTAVLIAAGDTIAVDQPVCEMETQKAVFEVPSTAAGRVKAVHVKTGQKLHPGDVLILVEPAVEGTAPAPRPAQAVETPKAETPQPDPPADTDRTIPAEPEPIELDDTVNIKAGPAVRQLARQLGVPIALVKGTGPHGRIQPEDIKAYAAQHPSQLRPPKTSKDIPAAPQAALASDSRDVYGPIMLAPFRSIRKKIAAHVHDAWTSIPHVFQFEKADVTELTAMQQRYKDAALQRGGKMTVTVFLIKAVVLALKELPNFNASLDAAKDEIIYKRYYNIGIAVDTDRGLVVPVVKQADRKSILELSVELSELAATARQGKTALSDFQGGTFTITNLGGIGGIGFTPIINSPEVAILGVSRNQMEPVVKDGIVVPRLMMPFTVSYDHRVVDGADGARFARRLKEILEDPVRFLIE